MVASSRVHAPPPSAPPAPSPQPSLSPGVFTQKKASTAATPVSLVGATPSRAPRTLHHASHVASPK